MKKIFNLKNRSGARTVLLVIAILLIGLDIYFAISTHSPDERKQYITFSRLYYAYQGHLLWFIFTMGCLVSKIFYNKETEKKWLEVNGIIVILAINLVLVGIGYISKFANNNVPTDVALLIFGAGIFASHYFWPQYKIRE